MLCDRERGGGRGGRRERLRCSVPGRREEGSHGVPVHHSVPATARPAAAVPAPRLRPVGHRLEVHKERQCLSPKAVRRAKAVSYLEVLAQRLRRAGHLLPDGVGRGRGDRKRD